MTLAATAIGGTVDRLVRWVIVPVTSLIPILARTGVLFAAFAAGWIVWLGAFALRPELLAAAWQWVAGWPLAAQAVAWLLALPLMAGMWVSQTDWPPVLSAAVMAGIAGWNLLVLRPGTPAGAASA
ncbi:MAG TPA: hypothetical protein VGK16_11815 [Candidatus Limnocylindrales bacterium]